MTTKTPMPAVGDRLVRGHRDAMGDASFMRAKRLRIGHVVAVADDPSGQGCWAALVRVYGKRLGWTYHAVTWIDVESGQWRTYDRRDEPRREVG